MQPTILEQTMVFFRAFLAGLPIAAVYTVISCIRAVSRPDKKLQFLGDLIFAVFAAAVCFLYSLSTSGGQLRAYAIAAELCAFLAVYLILGRPLARSAGRISRLISRACSRLTSPIGRAAAGVVSQLCAACQKITKKFKKRKI